MSVKNENDGSIPNSVFNNIFEHTLGGFMIFYFNSETGEPEQIMSCDSPAHAIALQKYISDWSKAVDRVNLENSVMSIQQSLIDSAEINEDEDEE